MFQQWPASGITDNSGPGIASARANARETSPSSAPLMISRRGLDLAMQPGGIWLAERAEHLDDRERVGPGVSFGKQIREILRRRGFPQGGAKILRSSPAALRSQMRRPPPPSTPPPHLASSVRPLLMAISRNRGDRLRCGGTTSRSAPSGGSRNRDPNLPLPLWYGPLCLAAAR
jgi:hypothetical protein